jgi:YjbE family integral membrane protein
MDGASAASTLGVLLQILFLDLLLSGDNALVIALACRRLPEQQARRAAILGAAGAILLRLLLTMMTGALMTLPFLQLLSALPLLVIALNLIMGGDEHGGAAREGDAQATMLAAVGVIIVSDAAMSLDNVVALAAVSGGKFWLLAFGLACTVPLIVFGSFGFSRLMRFYPWIADLGAALLGWVSGGLIVGDPLLAGWVQVQAPALTLAMPLACALFVLFQGRFARQNAAREAEARPKIAPPIRRPETPSRLAPTIAASAPTLRAEEPKPNVIEKAEIVEEPTGGSDLGAAEATTEEADEGDRWMVVGLIALFVIFGVFLAAFLMVPD